MLLNFVLASQDGNSDWATKLADSSTYNMTCTVVETAQVHVFHAHEQTMEGDSPLLKVNIF